MQNEDLNSIDLGFDIAIIGAGAAGCALAEKISEDFKVLLVDQKNFPRRKACSGILVSESEEILKNEDFGKFLVSNNKIDIEYVDVENKSSKLVKKGFLNSNRFLLDNYLFDKLSAKPNISFLGNTRLIEYKQTADQKHIVVVFESNGTVKSIITKYLIGCDGASSTIRSRLFSTNTKFYIGIQELIKVDKPIDHAYFIFDSEITDFYSWIIPKSQHVEIGALLDPYNTREKFELFKEKIRLTYNIKGNGKIESAIVLRPESVKDICLGSKNIFLCGEAAGLISPSSAEGISFALRSGVLCAEALNSKKPATLEVYKRNCEPLISRLKAKFEKAKLLSDKNSRKALFCVVPN